MLNLTELQKQTLEASNIHEQAIEGHWRMFPELSFEACVGNVAKLLKGEGQERNERFSPFEGDPSDDFKSATSRVE